MHFELLTRVSVVHRLQETRELSWTWNHLSSMMLHSVVVFYPITLFLSFLSTAAASESDRHLLDEEVGNLCLIAERFWCEYGRMKRFLKWEQINFLEGIRNHLRSLLVSLTCCAMIYGSRLTDFIVLWFSFWVHVSALLYRKKIVNGKKYWDLMEVIQRTWSSSTVIHTIGRHHKFGWK